MPKQTEVGQSTKGFNAIFIHSSLDDAGLTPQQFRVFAHLSRRASSGLCFASLATMSNICGLRDRTIRECLKVLRARKMISCEERKGYTTLWKVLSPDQWLAVNPCRNNTPPKAAPLPKGATTPLPFEYLTTPAVSVPTKVIPVKDIQEGNPNKSNTARQLAESVYEAYPKKVGFPVALRAIEKALKSTDYDTLLAATVAFAKARRGQDAQFTPMPATWFNQQRYLDDQSTWSNAPATRQKERNERIEHLTLEICR